MRSSIGRLTTSIGISSIGDNVFNVVVMWFVYEQTSSALLTSLVGVIWHVTSIVSSPFAGTVTDRHPPRLVMLSAFLFSAASCLLLAVAFTSFEEYSIIFVFLSIILLNGAFSFVLPAKNKMLGLLAKPQDIPKYSGRIATVNNIGDLVGNSISGFLIGGIGIVGSILFDSVTFIIAALFLLRMSTLETPQNNQSSNNSVKKKSFKEDLFDGVKELKSHSAAKKLMLLVLLVNVSSLIGPLFVVLISDHYNTGPEGYGIVQAFGVFGGIIGGLLVGTITKFIRPGYGLAFSWSLAGIMIIVIAINKIFIISWFIFFLYSFSLVLGNIFFESLMITLVPHEIRGRIGGISYSVSTFLIPLSTLIGGWVSDWTSVRYVFIFAGIWILMVGILTISLKSIRNINISSTNSKELKSN